jgi:hypothetical protein
MKISVQMDVFSGRPNPSWQPDPSESGEILKKLSLLTRVDKSSAVFPDDLGYRGFVISVRDKDSTTATPTVYRVYNGFVLKNGDVFSDNGLLEKQLIKQAASEGFGDLIESLGLK